MGAIVDRSKEHLGAGDAYLITVRKYLLKAMKAIQEGKEPPGLLYDPSEYDFSYLRCAIAELPNHTSWRTLFEDA